MTTPRPYPPTLSQRRRSITNQEPSSRGFYTGSGTPPTRLPDELLCLRARHHHSARLRRVADLSVATALRHCCQPSCSSMRIPLPVEGGRSSTSGNGQSVCTAASVAATRLHSRSAAPLTLRAGVLMLYRKVGLTPIHLTSSGSFRGFRRCARDEVLAMDIPQDNFGRTPRAVPFAVLRDGRSMPLMPCSVLITKGGQQLETQRPVVGDLRHALGVGGSDLAEADVRWMAPRRTGKMGFGETSGVTRWGGGDSRRICHRGHGWRWVGGRHHRFVALWDRTRRPGELSRRPLVREHPGRVWHLPADCRDGPLGAALLYRHH